MVAEGRKVTVETVDEYIAAQPASFRGTLEELREIVQSEAPDAEETISYRIPCFRHHYMLVGFGVTKRDCSFYMMNPELVAGLEEELEDVRHSGSTLHFTPGDPLPEELLRRIVRARVEENEARAGADGA